MKTFSIKHGVSIKDLELVSPYLLILLGATSLHCHQNNLPLVITSIKSDAIKVKRVSKSHLDGRALDISIKGWDKDDIDKFVAKMNIQYRHLAAISASDFKPRAAVYHDAGAGDHIHLQTRRID